MGVVTHALTKIIIINPYFVYQTIKLLQFFVLLQSMIMFNLYNVIVLSLSIPDLNNVSLNKRVSRE